MSLIDASRISPDELMQYVSKMIADGYSELPHYVYVMGDILSTGVYKFNEDLAKTRGWSNRVIGLLQQARQINAHVARIATGKWRIHEIGMGQCVERIKRNNPERLKGLDASERKTLARTECLPLEEEAENWDQLKGELSAYIDALEDTQKDLHVARGDLKAQLWAVRLHGVLGELAKEGQDTGVPTHRYNGYSGGHGHITDPGRSPGPDFEPPTGPVVDRRPELDSLLTRDPSA